MAYYFSQTGSISTLGTNYNVSKKASIVLSHSSSKYFLSKLCCVQVYINTILSASTLSIKITNDSNGDHIIVPDTAAAIDFGLTTTNEGVAVFDFSSILYSSNEEFYIFAKVDTGSCDISQIHVTFEND